MHTFLLWYQYKNKKQDTISIGSIQRRRDSTKFMQKREGRGVTTVMMRKGCDGEQIIYTGGTYVCVLAGYCLNAGIEGDYK